MFAYHGYPSLIHRLTYRRHNHDNIHVRGYKEEGTTTTPFDMVMLNDMDRYHLVMDVIERVPGLAIGTPRCSGRRWSTRDWRLARTHARWATILRTFATGCGRADRGDTRVRVLVVNGGSSSLKLRLLDGDDQLVASEDASPDDEDAVRRFVETCAWCRRGRPSGRPRR